MIERRTFVGLLLSLIPAAACGKPARASQLTVYKSPSCGCCSAWAKSVRAAGIDVKVHDMDDVTPIARKAGVPEKVRSCHTALAEGYFVEGHVPASDIRRLLRERPKALGIAVPGMPIGSPGMEQRGRKDTYNTLLVGRDGKASVFARHNQPTKG